MLGTFMMIHAQSTSTTVVETTNSVTSCNTPCTPAQIKECLKICTPEQIQKCMTKAGVSKLATKIDDGQFTKSTGSVSQIVNLEESAIERTCAKSISCCKTAKTRQAQAFQAPKT